MAKTTRQKAKEKLDKVFSLWVRTKDADHAGFTSCFTCQKIGHYKTMHAGHFQGRLSMSTRWHEQNVQVQCYRCNINLSGNQYIYGINLDKFYGNGTAESLHIKSKEVCKLSESDLRELISHYNDLLTDIHQ
jgi:hypothetical protein